MRKNKLYEVYSPSSAGKAGNEKNLHKSAVRIRLIIYNVSHIAESVYLTNFLGLSLIIKGIKQSIPTA